MTLDERDALKAKLAKLLAQAVAEAAENRVIQPDDYIFRNDTSSDNRIADEDIAPIPHRHFFVIDPQSDGLVCICGDMVSNENLAALGYKFPRQQDPYDQKLGALRDELGRANDAIKELMVENAGWRRRCEQLERKR